jgi:acetyl esterase/lipase
MIIRAFGRVAFAGLCAAFLSACSGLGMLDALTPSDGYVASRDIAYGPDPRQKLDVYAPEGTASAPVAIFWYGGSWASGSKAQYRFVAEALVRRGFVVVVPDYRLTPTTRFPDFIDDAAAAVDWTLANVGRYGGQAARVLLIGHSAGAYNATMAVLGRKVPLPRIAGVVSISGPADFDPKKGRALLAAFGHVDDNATTQPLALAKSGPTGDMPPFLLLHGVDDTVVAPRQSTALAAAIRDGGGRARAFLYPATGHADIMLGLTTNFAGSLRMLDEIVAFHAQALSGNR